MGTCSGPAWEPRTPSVPTHLAGSPGRTGTARGRKHPGQRPPAGGTPRLRGTHAPPPQALPGTSKNSTTPRGVLNTRGAPNPSRPQPHVLLGTWGGPGTPPPLSPPRCSGGPALPGGPSPRGAPSRPRRAPSPHHGRSLPEPLRSRRGGRRGSPRRAPPDIPQGRGFPGAGKGGGASTTSPRPSGATRRSGHALPAPPRL